MPLQAGTRLGGYEILAKIGVGGMGEVYQARDTRLKRDVALKVLPDHFAHDTDRLARFQREAELLATLNHPNIAGIYGLEESIGVRALVLEFVEGPTLADRIARGPIPLDEALPIAQQIAEALEAAHEKGVIHRDLKPANIKLTPDGSVKVLDFGLAKLAEAPAAPGAGVGLSQSPTITTPAMMTGVGTILGTAAYMSPEQAKGRPADRRSDIWAFGCVLFEMLTGKRAFEGEDVSDTLANVLKSEPAWGALLTNVPPSVHILLKGCLEKDRRQRVADISTAIFILKESASLAPRGLATMAPPTTVQRRPSWRRIAAPALGLIGGSLVTGTAVWFATRLPPPRVARLTITPSTAATLTVNDALRDLAISPDGTRIVYVGANGSQLFVRALDQIEPTPLTGLGGPIAPFFSPDGLWIGFFDSNSSLSKVAITGGPAVRLSPLYGNNGRGASWSEDGTIVFAMSGTSGLRRVSAVGGESTILTTPDRSRGEASHVWPEVLPGGRAVLFTIMATTGGIENAQVAVLDFRTGTQKILARGGSHAHYVRSGHLVYGAAGTLRAVAFDLDRLETRGPPVPVLSQVVTTTLGAADFDVARDGTLVYISGGVRAIARTLVWVDRHGHEDAIKAPPRGYLYARLSPDGSRVALDIRDQEYDVWLWDVARESLTRVTADPALDRFPVWTPDGQRLIFCSDRGSRVSNLFWQRADGTGAPERLTQSPNDQCPTAVTVTPAGPRLLFMESAPGDPRYLQMLTLDQERRVQPLLVPIPFVQQNGAVSPDGRWLAYDSHESGQFEVYVRPFPDVNQRRWLVSTGGGGQPLWARDGHELFYRTPTGEIMGVAIGRGVEWTAGAPVRVVEGRYANQSIDAGAAPTYDVSLDGRRFLVMKPGAEADRLATPATLIVVFNWMEELKQRVSTK